MKTYYLLKCVEVHFILFRGSVGFNSTVAEQKHWLKEEKGITINAILSCFLFHCLVSLPRLLHPFVGHKKFECKTLSLLSTINM